MPGFTDRVRLSQDYALVHLGHLSNFYKRKPYRSSKVAFS